MILVLFGTHNQDFKRLAVAIDAYAGSKMDEIVVQSGHTIYNFKNVTRYFRFCQRDEMKELINRAELIVMQGGWGAIDYSLSRGKKIVAVPRINGVEHVHNQEQLVRKLESIGCLKGCYQIDDLNDCIEFVRKNDFKILKKGSATLVIKSALESWFYEDTK